MNKLAVAKELVAIAKLLTGTTGTFECPNCGSKVLKNTGYCLKCKEKVKEAAETFECPNCGTKVLKNTGYCLKCKEKVKQAAWEGLPRGWTKASLKSFYDSLAGGGNAKKKFYHGSAGFRGRVIMADGLVPPSQIDMPHSRDEKKGPEFDDYVFLTTNKELAKTHADRRARYWGDNEYGPIVYEVEMEEDEVVPDDFDPIMYPESFKYKGIIPRERVKKVKI